MRTSRQPGVAARVRARERGLQMVRLAKRRIALAAAACSALFAGLGAASFGGRKVAAKSAANRPTGTPRQAEPAQREAPSQGGEVGGEGNQPPAKQPEAGREGEGPVASSGGA